jgi:hypothetical protein
MNEEELTEKLNTEKDIVEAFNNGFQKGKLEERERIRQLLGFFQSNMKVINEDEAQIRIDDWEDLKEQLQKEIGEEKGK